MRVALYLLVGLLLLPGVFAIGIGFPSELYDGQEFDVGDEETYIFLIRGDAVERDIKFFIQVNETGIFEFNGDDEYEKNYNVEEYEDIEVEIDFEAIDGGEVELTWGFRYLEFNSTGLGMEQVVANVITLEVDGDADDNDDADDYTYEDYIAEHGGSSGGGGGGAYIPPAVVEPEPVDSPVPDAVLQDISAQGSSTSEMVADVPVQRSTPKPVQLFGDDANKVVATSTSVDGKTSFTIVLVLFTVTAGLSFVSYKAAKGDEE